MCVKRILFLILKYLSFQFSYIRKLVCCNKTEISLLSMQDFRLWKSPFSPLLKLVFSLRIWLHLLEKSLMGSFIFCAVWNFEVLKIQKGICTCQMSKSWPKDIWTKVKNHCHCLNTWEKVWKRFLEALKQQLIMSTNNS